MQLTITPAASEWFQTEIGVSNGDAVNFYGKYGGSSPIHQGFSLGFNIEKPVNPLVQTEVAGVTYFVEATNEWYFRNHDLIVDYDSTSDEPIYTYQLEKTS